MTENGPSDQGSDRTVEAELSGLHALVRGPAIHIGNEFAEIRVQRVDTRNGSRLLIESPRSGQWVSLCPMELEALTGQNTATFSAMIGSDGVPLIAEETTETSEDTR